MIDRESIEEEVSSFIKRMKEQEQRDSEQWIRDSKKRKEEQKVRIEMIGSIIKECGLKLESTNGYVYNIVHDDPKFMPIRATICDQTDRIVGDIYSHEETCLVGRASVSFIRDEIVAKGWSSNLCIELGSPKEDIEFLANMMKLAHTDFNDVINQIRIARDKRR